MDCRIAGLPVGFVRCLYSYQKGEEHIFYIYSYSIGHLGFQVSNFAVLIKTFMKHCTAEAVRTYNIAFLPGI